MSDTVSFTARWFADELARHQRTFEQGDYSGFMEALLLCCGNDRPLPKWVATRVIQQAEEAFSGASTGPGRHGNWRANYNAIQTRNRRAELASFHLQARRRQGRKFVSELARIYGYGKPSPEGGGNIVTRDDVFEFVSKQLKGKPAQGSADVVKDSYKVVKRGRPRRRAKKPA